MDIQLSFWIQLVNSFILEFFKLGKDIQSQTALVFMCHVNALPLTIVNFMFSMWYQTEELMLSN